uniref:TspO/MBR family protein n=1 Tax=Pithovirus LCPAC202 TaxID=2506592 RepID=A0A481Z5R0_9VIRU|nr:MAG: TspO/MBR family protein [Pithovirus LCPAC202]
MADAFPLSRNIDKSGRVVETSPLEQAGVGRYDISSPVKSDGSINYFHSDHVKSGAFWAYLVIMIIVALCLFMIIRSGNVDGWYDRLDRPGTLSTGGLLFIWVFILIIVLIAVYVGHVEAENESTRMLLTWVFLLQIGTLIIWAITFYNLRNLTISFYIGIIAFLLAGWWIYLFWNINRAVGLLLIIHLIWVGYLVWSNWQILDKNEC